MDTRRCPICAGENDCALANGSGDGSACWCTRVTIDPAILARVETRCACLCQTCATSKPPKSSPESVPPRIP